MIRYGACNKQRVCSAFRFTPTRRPPTNKRGKNETSARQAQTGMRGRAANKITRGVAAVEGASRRCRLGCILLRRQRTHTNTKIKIEVKHLQRQNTDDASNFAWKSSLMCKLNPKRHLVFTEVCTHVALQLLLNCHAPQHRHGTGECTDTR